MRSIATFVATGLLLLASRPPLVSAAGTEREVAVDGEARRYLIHVPSTWDRVRPIPVLFVFHGAGGDSESMVEATGFDDMADRANMLVVYPEARRRTKRYDVDAETGGASGDVRFVDAILERLRGRFPVDARRVWASGFSNGATFCYRLAAERPQVFAAIAPVAGYLPSLGTERGALPVPLIHVHGSADGVVGAHDSPVAAWARRNGATKGPVAGTLAGSGPLVVRTTAYEGPTPRSDSRLLLVEGGGHSWAGGPGGPISRAIMDFLVAHPLLEPKPAGRSEGSLVGMPFGSTDALRWLTPEGRPVSLSAQRLTLFRWWTNGCMFCRASVPVLARLEDRWRARGLRMVGVYHPKGARLTDEQAREYARGLGFAGAIAFDDGWTKLKDLRGRGGLSGATSISVLVDAEGTVRWVHPGPQIDEGSPDLADLEALLSRLLPAAPASTAPR